MDELKALLENAGITEDSPSWFAGKVLAYFPNGKIKDGFAAKLHDKFITSLALADQERAKQHAGAGSENQTWYYADTNLISGETLSSIEIFQLKRMI